MPKLPPGDVDQFFRLYRTLQLWANEQVRVFPKVHTSEELADLKLEDLRKLRDAIYDHPELIERFVAENPAGLTAEELSEVRGWSRFVRGDFYILRHLKRYSAFLSSEKPARAYGVLGLSDAIEDMFPTYALPMYLNTVLLPFKGHIIWDGLINYYNITFGSGIRRDLNETYQRVKQREGIVESLTSSEAPTAAGTVPSRPQKAQPDLRPLLHGIVEAAEQLRPGATPVQSRAYSLLRAATRLAEVATADPADPRAVDEQLRALSRSYKQLVTAYDRDLAVD